MACVKGLLKCRFVTGENRLLRAVALNDSRLVSQENKIIRGAKMYVAVRSLFNTHDVSVASSIPSLGNRLSL